jgi:hypothetical protein
MGPFRALYPMGQVRAISYIRELFKPLFGHSLKDHVCDNFNKNEFGA